MRKVSRLLARPLSKDVGRGSVRPRARPPNLRQTDAQGYLRGPSPFWARGPEDTLNPLFYGERFRANVTRCTFAATSAHREPLVLLSSALGWVSLLTDPAFSGALVPTRPVHVASAALFCLSCVAWGWVLYRVGSRSLARPKH